MLTNTHTRYVWAKFLFCLIFHSLGKIKEKMIFFIRKHSNYNSPGLGSIFLIEVKRKQKKVYINEDRLLEGDQSNISIYRIVFYAEVFITVNNESASCLLCSRLSLL